MAYGLHDGLTRDDETDEAEVLLGSNKALVKAHSARSG